MDNLAEMKRKAEELAAGISRLKTLVTDLKGPRGGEVQEGLKKTGVRIGVGAALSLLGISVVAVAAVYVMAVIILLVNIALDRLWLSALIVVGASFIFGGLLAAVGFGVARKAAKDVPDVGGGIIREIKKTGVEVKEVASEIQDLARKEAEERKKQALEAVEAAKQVLPYVVAAYVGYRLLKRAARARKARRMVLLEEEI